MFLGQIEDQIAGFLVYHKYFFGHLFIDLVIVRPTLQRHGIAKTLMKYVENVCPTNKIFHQQINQIKKMQKVFNSLNYVRSGCIDNLDDEDMEIVFLRRLVTTNKRP
ncbi:GNAT family N-acetyltransferase (plasmid) [Bacillus megaterium]|nr:GNAT family N-acetyltransferase [Priestia megaterium]